MIKIAEIVVVDPKPHVGRVLLAVVGETVRLTPEQVDELIRALAAARVELSKEPPR